MLVYSVHDPQYVKQMISGNEKGGIAFLESWSYWHTFALTGYVHVVGFSRFIYNIFCQDVVILRRKPKILHIHTYLQLCYLMLPKYVLFRPVKMC